MQVDEVHESENSNDLIRPNSVREAATRLCLSCGLCCKGVLHPVAVLKPHELAGASQLGLDVVDVDGPCFKLPCPRYDQKCTVYEQRPQVCGRFRCALLRKLDDGEIGEEESLAIVGEALNLFDRAQISNQGPVSARTLWNNARKPVTDAEESGQWIDMTALAYFLDKHFVLARDGYYLSAKPIAPGIDQ